MAHQCLSFKLAERPTGEIIPGRTLKQELGLAPTEADLEEGQILIQALYLSLDPAMRGWISDVRSYIPPVQIGEVMRGMVLARTLASKSSRVKRGDLVTAMTGWAEVAIANEGQFEPVMDLPPSGRITDLLGVFGPTCLTAYFGMIKFGAPKTGSTVVISGAAGATGSVAGQIARMMGARVIGIAGSDAKCSWLKNTLGFNEALNYKHPEFKIMLEEATPDYIDLYWDNVGGEILDLALGRANKFATFIMCGGISQYNATEPQGLKNVVQIVVQRIRMQGFIVFDYLQECGHAREELAKWIAEGKIKTETSIIKGGSCKCGAGTA